MDTRKLPKLRDLKLAEQQEGLLHELPDEVGLLRVSKLNLQGNALQSLPESFYSMHTLETINLCAQQNCAYHCGRKAAACPYSNLQG